MAFAKKPAATANRAFPAKLLNPIKNMENNINIIEIIIIIE